MVEAKRREEKKNAKLEALQTHKVAILTIPSDLDDDTESGW